MPYIIPVVFFSRLLMKYVINQQLSSNTRYAANEVMRQIQAKANTKSFLLLLELGANIVFFLFCTQFSTMSKEDALGAFAGFYLLTIAYTVYKTLTFIPILAKWVTKYKFNAKKMLFDVIYEEVYSKVYVEMNSLPWYKSAFNNLFGKTTHEITSSITYQSIWMLFGYHKSIFVVYFIILIVHFVCSKIIVLPYFIEIPSNLKFTEILFYPFVLSIDLTFNTNVMQYLL